MNVTNDMPTDSSADVNENATLFNCFICGKEFSNEKRYFGHLRIHSGEIVWSCDKCPQSVATFDSESKLITHENLFHAPVRPHKCSKCDDVFDRASQLNYHQRSVHQGEKSQICQICGKGFFRKTDLRTHLNVHLGTNQSICEICGRKFNHVSNLIRHCRTHEGSKPYPCAICGKRFTQISSLARHKRIHSRESVASSGERTNEPLAIDDESAKIEPKKIAKRQHYCKTCGESFQFMVLLRQHERLHSKTAENCDGKSRKKDQKQESIVNELEVTEQTTGPQNFAHDHDQSSSPNWRDFHSQHEARPKDDVEENPENESTNSIRDHLLELDRKMSAIEIESERDVSISISDILSPYDCDEIQLSNSDDLETKIYENSNTANKHNHLDKDYDIVQCLNNVDFTSDMDGQSSVTIDEKNVENCDRRKSLTKDAKIAKPKPFASLIRDQYNKCIHVDVSDQLYIEISESDYLKNVNSHAAELQDIENVALFREVFDLDEDDRTKYPNTHAQKVSIARSSKIDEKMDATSNVDEIVTKNDEPSLRLVQTDTGEQFYELIINNNRSTEDFGNLDDAKEQEIESIDRVSNESQFPTNVDHCRTNIIDQTSNDREKCSSEPSSNNEFVQLASNVENRVDETTETDTSMPMVRLVQNEDGEQFFELVREHSEYEENRDVRIAENFDGDAIAVLPTNDDNSKSQSTTKEKKESMAENSSRPAKDRTRKFQCNECDKWFSTAYNCKQHAGTHFVDQQKFRCKDCGMSFAWKSTLNKHLAGNHRPDGPQKFVCNICPKVYSTLSQVNEHVKRDHLKERNHVCGDCGKSFFKKFDLKTHSRTHTNERPYVCQSCGKRFHHQSHIIRHERIHSGERPYACDVCQKSFTQPSALRAHRERHGDVKIDILEYRMDDDDPLAMAVR